MPDQIAPITLVFAGIVLLIGASALLLLQEARHRDLEARVAHAASGEPGGRPKGSGLIEYLRRLGERVRHGGQLYSARDLEQMEGLLAAAGYNPRRALPIVLGTKLALMIFLPWFAFMAGSLIVDGLLPRLGLAAVGLVVGMLGPDMVLSSMRRTYTQALERGMPDALDLMVVCTEAGMGLESAIERVAQEMPRSNSAMALALSGLLDDLRVLPDRREAFMNFGRRSGVESMQRLSSMLGQSLQFGTPLGQGLRAVAMELRRDRMNRMEEKAVKLPLKLIVPLMLFMLPTLMIIMAGTSFLNMFDAMTLISHPPQ